MIDSETITTVANTTSGKYLSVFSLITSTDWIGKSVMLLLIMASVWSWAIIFAKIFQIKRVKSNISKFEEIFWSGQILDQLYDTTKRKVDNPLAAVFISAMTEFKRGISTNSPELTSVKIGHKERIVQSMTLAKNREVDVLSKNLTVLALIGSQAIFLGLLGTVWGIMYTFQSIAASKNTTLAVVAPGIAEALLATAFGLVATIPASAFYNHLSNQVSDISDKVEDFISELANILSRAVDEEK